MIKSIQILMNEIAKIHSLDDLEFSTSNNSTVSKITCAYNDYSPVIAIDSTDSIEIVNETTWK